MKTHDPKTVEEIVEEQALSWEHRKRYPEQYPHRPLIAISRQSGTIARTVAEELAKRNNMSLFDETLIEEVAKQAHVNERMVRTLDERESNFIQTMLYMVEDSHHLLSDDYFKALVQVITTIERHGNAIILGRGATYLFRQHEDYARNLSVRIVAPLQERINRVSEERDLTRKEAEERIRNRDDGRKGFLRRYYSADERDLDNFDLVINNAFFDVNAAVELIETAYAHKSSLFPDKKAGWKTE